jgi:hypothetical protein
MLTAVAVLLAVFTIAIFVDVIAWFFKYGYTLGGKADIYVPLFPVLTFFFAKWSYNAWSAWNYSRKSPCTERPW